MSDYRIYYLASGHKIAEAAWIRATSDDEAVVLVRAKKPNVRCEIWHGQRLVAQIPPTPTKT
jgi:hypothetical protein